MRGQISTIDRQWQSQWNQEEGKQNFNWFWGKKRAEYGINKSSDKRREEKK